MRRQRIPLALRFPHPFHPAFPQQACTVNDSGDKNWRIRVDGETLGPFSEVEMRHWLAEHRDKKSEVQQGSSDWYPAAVILQRFKELARSGIYLRINGQVEGPYTRPRFVQRIEQLGNVEVDAKEGNDGFWVSAKVILRELNLSSLVAGAGNARRAHPPTAAVPKTPVAAPQPATSAAKKTTEPPPLNTAPSNTVSPIRVSCPVCKATLQIPADQMGKTVRCASCKKQIRVVGKSSDANTPARPAPAEHTDPANDVVTLGEDDFAASASVVSTSVFAPLDNVAPISPTAIPRPYTRPQPQPSPNPYASPGPPTTPYYAGAQHRGTLPHPALYIVPGILIATFSLVMVTLSCFGVTVNIRSLMRLDADNPRLVMTAINLGLGLTWVMMYGVTLAGAIHMILRRNLMLARTSAILASIPCIGFPLGCLLFPVGIMSCVVLFMNDAKRVFQK